MSTEAQQQPIIQRPLRGSRISTFYPVKSLPSLSSLDSAFQLQEYISLLIRLDVHDVEAITSLPGATKGDKAGDKEGRAGESGDGKDAERDVEKEGVSKDVTVDEACWIYEQLRRLAQDLTHPLITTLQQECSRSTCPEMKAGEWLYLCVAHGNDGATEQCCAIDYILHTLDSATALLNSPRAFPSRLQIPAASHRHFSSLARRLGRIFAHAYFHHREAFEQAEAESSLYARFLALTNKFDLVPSEFLVIPTTADDEEEYDEHSRDANFGLREAKSGTSYDPRRSLGQQHPLQQQQQQQQQQPLSGATDDFPGMPRSRHPMEQRFQSYEFQARLQGHEGSSGGESPRKMGRSRTDTMVHSEIASVVDDLVRNAARASDEDQERRERDEREREGREREKAETEQREMAEAEAKRKAEEREAEEEAEGQATQEALDDLEGDGDGDDSKPPEPPEPQPSSSSDEPLAVEDEKEETQEGEALHPEEPEIITDTTTEVVEKEEAVDTLVADAPREIQEAQEEPTDKAEDQGASGSDGEEQAEERSEENVKVENQVGEAEEMTHVGAKDDGDEAEAEAESG